MSHKNVSKKCNLKMFHHNISFFTFCTFKYFPSMYTFCTFCTFNTFSHHPSSINVYFLYFLPSSIVYQPSMYTFSKTVKKNEWEKTVKNDHIITWSDHGLSLVKPPPPPGPPNLFSYFYLIFFCKMPIWLVLVLLSALVKRFGVSHMGDFFITKSIFTWNFSYHKKTS